MESRRAAPRRRQTMWAPAALLPALLLSTACEIGRTPRPQVINADSAAASEIRATLDGYQEAILSGSPARAAQYFDIDSRLQAPGLPDLTGAAEIQAALRDLLRGSTVSAIALDRSSIELARSGAAYELGSYHVILEDGAAVRGRYAIRWRRGPEGSWLIGTLLANRADEPAAIPAAEASPEPGTGG